LPAIITDTCFGRVNAVEQARTVFTERVDDRLAAVEIFDTEAWVEDVVFPLG
jgi:hypothetical protein